MHTEHLPASVRHPGIALAVILACHLMVTLDATVVNIAMPSMKESLGFSPTGLSWVFSAYTLAFGGLLLLGGRAGDLFGRRRMLIGGVASLVYALTRSSSTGWSDPTTLAALGGAAVLLAIFAATQRRSSQPMVPSRLLVERNRVGAYLNMLLLPAAMFGVFFFVTQFLQVVLGLTPLQAGLGFLPMALGMFGLVRIVPRLLPRVGARRLMALGIGLMTVAMAWLAQIGPHSGYVAGLLGPLLLIGVGMGMAIVPVSVTVLTGVRAQDSGAASGLLQTMQWVGGTLGLAILVSAFGVATRGASGRSLDAGALALPRDVMVAGMDGAFLVAACFTTAALGVALMVLRPDSATRAYERGSPLLTEPSL